MDNNFDVSQREREAERARKEWWGVFNQNSLKALSLDFVHPYKRDTSNIDINDSRPDNKKRSKKIENSEINYW